MVRILVVMYNQILSMVFAHKGKHALNVVSFLVGPAVKAQYISQLVLQG